MRKLVSRIFLAGLLASISAGAAAQTTITADAGFARSGIAECRTDLRYLNQVSGWQVTWPRQWSSVAAAAEGFEEAAARWSNAAGALDTLTANLQTGMENGEAAPQAVVLRVAQQVRELAAGLEERDERYFSDRQDAQAWNAVLSDEIRPALGLFHDFLYDEYLPAAKATPGLLTIDDGKACFERAAAFWTTLPLKSEEIEAAGNRLLEETREDLAGTGKENETFADIMTRLRASQNADETTEAELIEISQTALDRAQEATLKAFSKKAERRVIVEPMAKHLHASAPAGYYRPPQGDGPAGYIINSSRPGERRLMAEVIAFHEGVPGHHLFFDYPREVESSGFNAGILEGWALYSEYVADEMDLFSTTLDRQGMMTKHLWAASRLIVEPGLHLHGWSREDAINFMLENTVLARAEIEIEVDRYIAMPGHSLSYMIGAELIMSERERARKELGEAFDVRAFHDVVLAPGVRPLPQVRADIRAWTEKAQTERNL